MTGEASEHLPYAQQNEQSKAPRVAVHRLAARGDFPNNGRLPVLLYRMALSPDSKESLAERFEATFAANRWTGAWRDVVYDLHHYHGTAHEVLGCYAGRARLQVGGPGGPTCELHPGDVLVLPAGIAHRSVKASRDFRVVGAYAEGRPYDMLYGKPEERPAADQAIESVPLPTHDPVYGDTGPLIDQWAPH